MPNNNKIESIFVSDLHVGRGEENDPRYDKIKEFLDYVDREEPVFFGLIGDIADPWDVAWEKILQHPTWKKLQDIVLRRDNKGLETVWIHENHDSSAEQKYLPGADLKPGTVELKAGDPGNPGKSKIILRHGWQWGVFWGGIQGLIPGLAPLLFWIQEHHPRLARGLNYLYRLPKKIGRKKQRTPSTQKQKAKGKPREQEQWNLGMIWIHGNARIWAIKEKSILIFGHTHYPDLQVDINGETGVINTGDWLDSYSYVVYEKGKLTPELRQWP